METCAVSRVYVEQTQDYSGCWKMRVNYKIIQAKDFIKAKPTGEIDLEESKKVLGQLTEMADLHELVLEFGRHRCMSSSRMRQI